MSFIYKSSAMLG